MKRILFSLAFASMLWSCKTVSPVVTAVAKEQVEVAINLNDVKDDKVMVTITAPKISLDEVTYSIPKIVPGTYSIDNYGKFIEDFKAFDSKENLLSVTKTDDNTWSIKNAKTLVKITYWVNDSFDTEKLSGTTLHLSRKLGAAYKARAVQADTIASIRNRSPYKVIICGDFNDVPVSYAYTKIKGNLKDAFSETGFGLGWTLNLSIYKFRIDYVLYDATFTTNYFNISKVKYSDHYPVYCQLNIN